MTPSPKTAQKKTRIKIGSEQIKRLDDPGLEQLQTTLREITRLDGIDTFITEIRGDISASIEVSFAERKNLQQRLVQLREIIATVLKQGEITEMISFWEIISRIDAILENYFFMCDNLATHMSSESLGFTDCVINYTTYSCGGANGFIDPTGKMRVFSNSPRATQAGPNDMKFLLHIAHTDSDFFINKIIASHLSKRIQDILLRSGILWNSQFPIYQQDIKIS